MGYEYREGETISTTLFTCLNGDFSCINQSCVLNGTMCAAYGDPHYVTYDRRRYDFMGTCEYFLSAPCDRNDFIITGINKPVTRNPFADAVRIVIPKQSLEILLTGNRCVSGEIYITTAV